MNKPSRPVEYMGILKLEDINWSFRVYLLSGDPTEVVEKDELWHLLEKKARIVDLEYLSDEYKYLRTGFILAHYGRRGVTHSIWHWADWEGTWEYFCQAWYCYGRELGRMAPLDRVEPILCQHEIEVVMYEGLKFKSLARHRTNHEDIISMYRAAEPYRQEIV